jgi:uncharacterized protein YsxB (DUF464 family)
MINVKFVYEKGNLKHIQVSGHAQYKPYGKDIVCAAVSTAIIVTANAIEHLKLNHKVDLTLEDGYFKVSLKEDDQTLSGLLENLEYTLNDIQNQYPKYMKNQKEG